MRSMFLLSDAQIDNAIRIGWNAFDQKKRRGMSTREVSCRVTRRDRNEGAGRRIRTQRGGW